MKNCPHCNSAIEENASFCLHCMSSLDSKTAVKHKKVLGLKKVYLIYAAIAVCFVLLVAVIIWLTAGGKKADKRSGSTNTSGDNTSHIDENKDGESYDEFFNHISSVASKYGLTANSEYWSSKSENSSDGSFYGESSQGGTSQGGTSQGGTSQGGTSQGGTSQGGTSQGGTSQGGTSQGDTTSSQAPSYVPSIYEYKFAYSGFIQDYNYEYSNYGSDIENYIYITGIKGYPEGNILYLPTEIHGYKVIGIDSYAFAAKSNADKDKLKYLENITTVVVPENIKIIKDLAFKGQKNITDFYLLGNEITLTNSFYTIISSDPEKVTLHCSYDCQTLDKYYRYCEDNYRYHCEYEYFDGNLPF